MEIFDLNSILFGLSLLVILLGGVGNLLDLQTKVDLEKKNLPLKLMAEKDTKLANLTDGYQKKEQELAQLHQQLGESTQEYQTILTQKEQELVELRQQLGDSTQEYQTILTQKEQELVELRQQLGDSAQEYQTILTQKEQKLAELHQQLGDSAQEYQVTITEKEQELIELRQQLGDSAQEYQTILTQKDQELEQLRQQLGDSAQEFSKQLEVLIYNKEIEFKYMTFAQLQTLLVYYPSVRKIVETRPNLTAKNLIHLFSYLDKLLQDWEYEGIGTPGEQVIYNPEYHETNDQTIQPGELVYIRLIGYKNQTKIVALPQVSRTFPS